VLYAIISFGARARAPANYLSGGGGGGGGGVRVPRVLRRERVFRLEEKINK